MEHIQFIVDGLVLFISLMMNLISVVFQFPFISLLKHTIFLNFINVLRRYSSYMNHFGIFLNINGKISCVGSNQSIVLYCTDLWFGKTKVFILEVRLYSDFSAI